MQQRARNRRRTVTEVSPELKVNHAEVSPGTNSTETMTADEP